jgi:ribosomal protein S18 acetylase RimI-like enzyme
MNAEYAAADLVIRAAEAADIPALSASLGAVHGTYYRRRLPLQLAAMGVILLAERGVAPVGAAFVTWLPALEREVRRELPGVPLLYHMEVRAAVRRQGIGERLLLTAQAILARAGHRRMALGVDLHNTGAIRLYERQGFRRWNHQPLGAGSAAYDMMVVNIARPVSLCGLRPAA